MKRLLTTVVLMGTLAAMTCGLMAAEPTTTGTPTPVPKAQPGRLTLEQLGKMLDNLGYNPKPYADKDGKVVGYSLSFKSDNWTFGFSASLSPDQTNIWFNTGLIKVDDLAHTSPAALLAALGQNRNIWPAYLYYVKEYSLLRLAMPMTNNDVTASKLRQQVEDFTRIIKMVITEYERTSKPVQPTPPGPAKLPF